MTIDVIGANRGHRRAGKSEAATLLDSGCQPPFYYCRTLCWLLWGALVVAQVLERLPMLARTPRDAVHGETDEEV